MATMKTNPTCKGDLTKVMSEHDLKIILQCRQCSKTPYPPIYQCGRGHIVCCRCRDKMGNCYKFVKISNCTFCQEPPIVSRNSVLEKVFEKSSFKCEYLEQGCEVNVLGANLKKHLANCEFRPISCHLGRIDECNKSTIDFADYALHLNLVHNFTALQVDPKGKFQFNHSLTLPFKRTGSRSWKNFYLTFDGKIFIPRMSTYGSVDLLKFHMALLGSVEAASKYLVKMEFPGKSKSKVLAFQFHIPVYSIRLSDKEVSELHQGILNFGTLATLGHSDKTCGREKLEWTINYQITKI